MSPGSSTESYPAFAHIGLRKYPGKNLNQVTCPDRESNPGHLFSQPDALTVTPQHRKLPSICSYWVEGNPGKNLNQVTCPDRESNPGHLVSRPNALTVTPQVWTAHC
ncbi:hypothetical protein ANN_05782 [Periplaneta americana]|uniref:Uncharacterized protein n=1 Tax=Periplaneta americana TaxID=6978 RepID=A0ABQ8TCN0_PERAM|nr:hypothetical protein ANN_05782 [Periplaneta americana]